MNLLHKVLKKVVPQALWRKARGWLADRLRALLHDEKASAKINWAKHPQVSIGRYTYGIVHESVPLMDSVNWSLSVGSFCSIAPGVRFVFGRHEHLEGPTTFPIREFVRGHWDTTLWEKESIQVGHDVWIASNVLVLSGAKIGHGAVIGAGAVVARDIPPYAIAAGVPAKVLRWRMSEEQRSKMMEIAWWDWSKEKILANEALLYGDLDAFIATHWASPGGTAPVTA